MDDRSLGWYSSRLFGAEMELNAFDGKSRPDNREQLPSGIETVAQLVTDAVSKPSQVMGWHPTHNNDSWIIKPDSSCGIEVCSPVVKGWHGLEEIVKVSDRLRKDVRVKSDHRCSFHVHVNLADCSPAEIATIIVYWIKCEPVFMDTVPANRKHSRYCQPIGLSDLFHVEDALNVQGIIDKMGRSKYFSLNNYHMSKGKRKTIEFRIAENSACLDPYFVKNWCRLLLHFCERAKSMGLPKKYQAGDPWSSFCWLDPKDVFKLLGFLPGQYELSPGLYQTRKWFLARALSNTNKPAQRIFSGLGREYAWMQYKELSRECDGLEITEKDCHISVLDLLPVALFDKNLIH